MKIQPAESSRTVNLAEKIKEYKGSRQGHKRASGNFKTFINPCLKAAEDSKLGFCIGAICVSAICVADDTRQ